MTDTDTLIPNGAWPVMVTPFTEDLSIDWAALEQMVEYYAEAGVAGLFSVCLSSEMYQLSPAERIDLASTVVRLADGRMPVIASAVGWHEPPMQIEAVKAMADSGVAATVLLPALIAGEAMDDATWKSRLDAILAGTGDIPLGFYEVPRPYKRGVSPEALGWAAQTGRVLFHKDTCHEMAQMKAKLAATKGTGMKFFTTQMGSLVEVIEAGGHGFSSYAANIYPELVQWVSVNATRDRETALRIQNLLAIAEHSINSKYPASAKYFIGANAGIDLSIRCRSIYDTLSVHDRLPLDALISLVRDSDLPVPLAGQSKGGA